MKEYVQYVQCMQVRGLLFLLLWHNYRYGYKLYNYSSHFVLLLSVEVSIEVLTSF